MTNFIPLKIEDNKEFKSLEELIINKAQTPYYRITYKDSSYEDFEVETAAEAFRLSSKPKEIKVINLCFKPLAN